MFDSDREGSRRIFAIYGDANKSDPPRLTNTGYSVRPTSCASDSSDFAYSSNRDGNYEIYVQSIHMVENSSNPGTRLTNNALSDLVWDWSPDGTELLFTRGDGSTNDLYIMNANGTNQRQLTDDGTYKTHATWSPDGNWIMFQTSPNNSLKIIKVDGTNQMTLAESIGNPEWIASY